MHRFYFVLLFLSLFNLVLLDAQEVAPPIRSLESVKNEILKLSIYEEVHLTSPDAPIQNGQIVLENPSAFLVFDHIRPSEVIDKWLPYVLVAGHPAIQGENCRVCVYKHGTAVMSSDPDINPLMVFTESGFKGDSATYEINTYHKSLGDKFDNTISSLKLKRGYSLVLANNSDGSGYSRYFVADKGDLEIEKLPELLNDKVSFIRIFPWEWPSKKGWCDTKGTIKGDKVNSTWYYSWGIGQKTTPNQQYVPGKEQKYWPSFASIEQLKGFSHLYTYTEPDNKVAPDRMMTPDEVIQAWPTLLKTGMRIGAPAFMYENNIYEFMRKADSLEYRVDFVVVHCYWGAKSAARWYADLKTIHEKTGRPLWIKEWNTGGNWTHEPWPALFKDQLQSQYEQIKGILQVMDTAHFVERYSIYNWVEEKRSMILDIPDSTYLKNIDKQQAVIDTVTDPTTIKSLTDKLNAYKTLFAGVKSYRDEHGELTPAGIYYRDNKPEFAFSREREVIPRFTYRRPVLKATATNRESYQLLWEDLNGEMTNQIVLQKRIGDGAYESLETYSRQSKGTVEIKYEASELPVSFRLRITTEEGAEYYSDEISVVNAPVDNQVGLGSLELKNNTSTILNFTPSFTGTPVLLLGTPTYKNGYSYPLTSHVLTSFSYAANLRLEQWIYQQGKPLSKSEKLPFLALRTGSFQWGEIKGTISTVSNVNDRWKKVLFASPFDTVPVVFATRLSAVSTTPTTLRIRNVTTTGFEICQQKELKSDAYVAMDKVCYLAVLPGKGVMNGHCVEVGFTPEASVGGITPYSVKLNQSYRSPLVFAATQSYNDTTVFTTRLASISSNTVSLINNKELSAGPNRVLNKEQLAYLVIDAEKSVTSLSKPGDKGIRVYPTMTNSHLCIEGLSAPEEVRIFNMVGSLVKEVLITDRVEVSDLSSGYYILKLTSGSFRFIKK